MRQSSTTGSGDENRARWLAEIAATARLGAPIAVAFLAEIGIVVADAVMAGKLGARSLAAEGLASHLLFTPQLLAMGVLSSVAAVGAHADGAADPTMVTRVARQGLWLATLLALPVIAAILVIPSILDAAGYQADLVAMIRGMLYAGIAGVPALLWYTALRNFATVLGKTRIVVVISLISVTVAVISNWFLLYGNLGAPALGVPGVGVSWSIASWAQLIALVIYVRRQKVLAGYRVLVDLLHPDFTVLKDLYRVGWPVSVAYAFETGLFLATGLMMARISADALAAHTVVINISSVSYMIPYGICQAATVRVGFCTGAGDPVGARRAGFVAMLLAIAWMLMSGTAMVTFPRALIGLYIDLTLPENQGALAIGLLIIPICALFQVVDGLQSTAIGALRGLKDTKFPMVICFVGYWMIGFVAAVLLGFPAGLGSRGVWLGLLIGLFAAALLLTLRFRHLSQRLVRVGHGATVAPFRAV